MQIGVTKNQSHRHTTTTNRSLKNKNRPLHTILQWEKTQWFTIIKNTLKDINRDAQSFAYIEHLCERKKRIFPMIFFLYEHRKWWYKKKNKIKHTLYNVRPICIFKPLYIIWKAIFYRQIHIYKLFIYLSMYKSTSRKNTIFWYCEFKV